MPSFKPCRCQLEPLERRQLLSLVIDLRLIGGGKEITVDSVGDTVSMEAWAVVTGANADISDEGVQIVVGSFLSNNVAGGSALGDLTLTRVTPFNGNGSTDGASVDLDGDGDLDIGSNTDSSATGFYAGRSNAMTTGAAAATGGGAQFKLADLTFTVSSLLNGASTEINFRPRVVTGSGATGLWREDGAAALLNGNTGSFAPSTPVVVHSTGFTGIGSIAGTVFKDTNFNGALNTGEPGLSNWTVFLDTDNDGALDPEETSVLTDASGLYSFPNLAAGAYHVVQVPVASFALVNPPDGSQDVSLAAGENRMHVDFANTDLGQIKGTVWADTDLDGNIDGNEPGRFFGWIVFIDADHDGARDPSEKFTNTNNSGLYTLGLLPPGQHEVHIEVSNGYAATTSLSRTATVAAGQIVQNQDFGALLINARIGGTIYNDLDNNGLASPGEEATGRLLFLDQNNNGVRELSEQITIAGGSGAFQFELTALGTYYVRPVIVTSTLVSPVGGVYVVTIDAPNDVVTGCNFLVRPASSTFSISGVVYDDTDADGIRDTGESGLPNWGVYIDMNRNGLLDSSERKVDTNSDGAYTFDGLATGRYRIRELLYPGFRRVAPSTGYHEMFVGVGQSFTGKNFGNTKLALITGNVFKDTNGNGKRDVGESGLYGWRVWDDIDNDGVLDAGEKSVLTDGSGNYTLNVSAGWHYIRVQQKSGYARTTALYHKILVGDSTRVYDKLFGYKPIV